MASDGEAPDRPLTVLVTGASGNIGTALLRHLARHPGVGEVRGVCRRVPDTSVAPYRTARWHSLDVSRPDSVLPLAETMTGADAVVHLAWQLQPSHDERAMRRTNVEGTRAVVQAALAAGVSHLVYASSLAAYAPGPKDRAVDESWPTTGIRSSAYSRHKADTETLLDEVEASHPELTVARFRPGLVVQRAAGSEIGRYFFGPLVPKGWVAKVPLPAVPLPSGLCGQVVHADDVADAIARILTRRAGGPFNLAADPPLTTDDVRRALRGVVHLPLPWLVARATAGLTWRARLQPTSEGWVDVVHDVPVTSTERARRELGWAPRWNGPDALADMLRGVGDGAGEPSPLLRARRS